MEEFLLTNPELETSNNHLTKIKDLADPNSNFEVSFEIVSKNPGIGFLFQDIDGKTYLGSTIQEQLVDLGYKLKRNF